MDHGQQVHGRKVVPWQVELMRHELPLPRLHRLLLAGNRGLARGQGVQPDLQRLQGLGEGHHITGGRPHGAGQHPPRDHPLTSLLRPPLPGLLALTTLRSLHAMLQDFPADSPRHQPRDPDYEGPQPPQSPLPLPGAYSQSGQRCIAYPFIHARCPLRIAPWARPSYWA